MAWRKKIKERRQEDKARKWRNEGREGENRKRQRTKEGKGREKGEALCTRICFCSLKNSSFHVANKNGFC